MGLTERPFSDPRQPLPLTTAIPPDAGSVSGDPERLQQVVWNLLSNAVKFTPPEDDVLLEVHRDIYATLRIPAEMMKPVRTWQTRNPSDDNNR